MTEHTLEAHHIVSMRPDLANEIARIVSAKNRNDIPKTRMSMTKAQRDLYEFIRSYSRANGGVAPSYDEMAQHLGLASKSGIYRLITALEERGLIRRLPHRARAIVVVDQHPEYSEFNRLMGREE